jgi:hypothetical protein
MANKQSERKKKRKQRKKGKLAPNQTQLQYMRHLEKKRDVKMNLMMGEIMIQIIEASRTRCSKTANTCKARIKIFFSFFFICTKAKLPLVLNNTNKKYYEITTKPLKLKLKNLNYKCNRLIIIN